MGVKVKGVSKAVKNLDSIVNTITGKKVVRALQSAMIIGSSRAALYTPIDTSYLLNSQFREIVVNGTRFTGRVGYTANYAAYVHDPANVQTFRRPTAEKEFLTKGFEDERGLIDKTVAQEMSL
ncbi:HK97 gp10 family phage protein [Rahnella variigena]|uniref:HK97 gp10 family phage protein n=1 Tax=Rahnella variigena TaxID=574964 RepID=UPI001330E2C6|nr:HK97 gp10 family phage protein [Rahnella variigena]